MTHYKLQNCLFYFHGVPSSERETLVEDKPEMLNQAEFKWHYVTINTVRRVFKQSCLLSAVIRKYWLFCHTVNRSAVTSHLHIIVFHTGRPAISGQLNRHTDSLRPGQSGDRICVRLWLSTLRHDASVLRSWNKSRSQWPSGLRRGSAADRLLGLRVRIPPEAWMFVCVCCKDKSKTQDSQDKETSMDEVHTEYKRILKNFPVWETFSALLQTVLGSTQHSIQWYRVACPGVKRPGRGVNHPPPSSTKVRERVELYT